MTAWLFGESFDCYNSNMSEAVLGYWDGGVNPSSSGFTTGRFSGSRALNLATPTTLYKSSGANHPVHHFALSFQIANNLSSTNLGNYLELFDGATGQCSVVFKGNGDILLTSGGPNGTVLATYAGAITTENTWYAFEFEVVIHNTNGSFTVRKNGNPVADFTATGLNTRGGTTNNYANKLQIGSSGVSNQYIDDLLWKSDDSAFAWLGDIRCVTRVPATDASVQFSAFGTSTITSPGASSYYKSGGAIQFAIYSKMVMPRGGKLTSVSIFFYAFTANAKLALFADNNGAPGAVLDTSPTIITNPTNGQSVFSFPNTVLAYGQAVWVGLCLDTWPGNITTTTGTITYGAGVSYASFPSANPAVVVGSGTMSYSMTMTPNNSGCVNEAQQDGVSTYIYSSVAGSKDTYTLSPASVTPQNIIMTTVKAFMTKSDAGTRTAKVHLDSGSASVDTPTAVLSTSNWSWLWRNDTVDPNTGQPWTQVALNNVTFGPVVVS